MTPDVNPNRLDFALLQSHALGNDRRNRLLLVWLLGLMLLAAGSVVALVLYLQTFENEEADRQRVADGQWLERTVRFHLRRLEDDLGTLALRAREADAVADAPSVSPLRLPSGVLLHHGWLPAEGQGSPIESALRADENLEAENAERLALMQTAARDLRRPSYAGPMFNTDSSHNDRLWLAVPLFERGQFVGNYLACLSLSRLLGTAVPNWFLDNHRISWYDDHPLHPPESPLQPTAQTWAYQVQLDVPGTQITLSIETIETRAPWLPRLFFAAAVLFLLGMLGAVWALWRDTVKRQRIEQELQAQVTLRQAMENAVNTGLRVWDTQARLLYVNRAFCQMVGHDTDELIGRSAPLPYWPASQADELNLVHRELMTRGTEAQGLEVQFQHRDGHLIDVLIHEAPLLNATGEQLGWISSVIDISARKRAERLAAQQQEKLEALGRLVAVGEVASTLAHELNQPLGALSGFATGLVNRLDSGRIALEEVKPVVGRMAHLADKAGRIIQRVNAFARRREMHREPLELRGYLARVLKPLRADHTVQWQWLVGNDKVWVDADPGLLEHAVRNVTGNAADWAKVHAETTSMQPVVKVALTVQGDEVGIAISDSGPGVSPEQREHIFSAFFSGKPDGMGMGLAICRSVVEAHSGRIEVGNDPDLGGARFTLWLPLLNAGSTGDTLQKLQPHHDAHHPHR